MSTSSSAPQTASPATEVLAQPITLPNGVEIKNRFAKGAMTERLADYNGHATDALVGLYRAWAKGGLGLIVTGNTMVTGNALEAACNLVIEDRSGMEMLKKLAASTEGTGAKLIVQLSHPGRQTMRGVAIRGQRNRAVAPSPIKIKIGVTGPLFKKPKELTSEEIRELIEAFADRAAICAEAGFDGIQLHGAHGYLISQFLAPNANQRTDEWGGSLENRARFLLECVRAVKARVPKDFIVSVKMNSADFQRGGFQEEDSIQVAKWLVDEGVDLLEISGGTYEATAMVKGREVDDRDSDTRKASTQAREAYFLEFAERFGDEIEIPLMLTGGFRSAAGMAEAIQSGKVDMVGIARPVATEPNLPNEILSGAKTESVVRPHGLGLGKIDAFLELYWHFQQFGSIGTDGQPKDRGDFAALMFGLGKQNADLVKTNLPKRG